VGGTIGGESSVAGGCRTTGGEVEPMPVLVMSREVAAKLLAERRAAGDNRWDEVWDGVHVIMPEADIEHDDISAFLIYVFRTVFAADPGNRVHGRVNVSDRVRGWTTNFRVPDTAVFLAGNPARDCRTHYFGGPDLAVEIVSPDDRSRDKLDFYAAVGTREVLMVDRGPWQLELYQLRRSRMRLAGAAAVGEGDPLPSSVLPLSFQLVRGRPRPKVKVVHIETDLEWVG
jgi:Uma2 family endonuclease